MPPDVLRQFATLLNAAGYAVKFAPTVDEIVPMLDEYNISTVIIGAAWSMQLPNLHKRVPVLTIGNPRTQGHTWLDVASGAATQEWAFIPFDIEEVLAKVEKISGN